MAPRTSPLWLAALASLLAGCSIDLHHGLTESDANEIYVLLSKNGITARKHKEEGGNELRFSISVPKADAAQAAELLKTNSLPRPQEKGFSVFDKKSMVPTSVEERAMMLKAVGGEVSNALNQIDGVLDARAIVMIPEHSDLTQADAKPLPSASVFIKYRPTKDGRQPISGEDVKRFVATAVTELKPEAVTVLMSQALPPAAQVSPESRIQDVLGLKMTAASAASFKIIASVASFLIIAMAGFTTWHFLRGTGTPRARRARSPEA